MRHEGPEGEMHDRPSVIKDRDLQDFDRLEISEGGWARSSLDVDYSERLVFSDEEDNSANDPKRLGL